MAITGTLEMGHGLPYIVASKYLRGFYWWFSCWLAYYPLEITEERCLFRNFATGHSCPLTLQPIVFNRINWHICLWFFGLLAFLKDLAAGH